MRADTARDAAASADVILSMVADDEASRAVWTGTTGALDAARPGVLLIESSTLSPSWVEELADEMLRSGTASSSKRR